MNTTELNGTEYTLTEGEGGKITLTPLIKQPSLFRIPEAGDVWLDDDGSRYTIDGNGYGLAENGWRSDRAFALYGTYINERATYLGKFHEVYVQISEVRSAFGQTDSEGECMLDYFILAEGWDHNGYKVKECIKALRKLNIITD